jgi:hypothetical protein
VRGRRGRPELGIQAKKPLPTLSIMPGEWFNANTADEHIGISRHLLDIYNSHHQAFY